MIVTQMIDWAKKVWRGNKVLGVLLFIVVPILIVGAVVVKAISSASFKTDLREYDKLMQDATEVKEENKVVVEENTKVVATNTEVKKSTDEVIAKVEANIETRNEQEKELFK